MTYGIRIYRAAVKALADMPARERKRVADRIDSLARQPRPRGARKLHAKDEVWRVRVGNWRILYRVSDAELVVLVIRVADRRDAYR